MATSGSGRSRRFSLPELADDRVDESVRAFLHGPERERGRREASPPLRDAANPFASLATRIAWMEALGRESARNVRYRRPAAVIALAIEPNVGVGADGWVGRVARPVAHALLRGVRETDLVTRAGDALFQVLLPETTAREAQRVGERIATDCEVWLRAIEAPVAIRVAAAGTGHDLTLETAFERAVDAIRPAT